MLCFFHIFTTTLEKYRRNNSFILFQNFKKVSSRKSELLSALQVYDKINRGLTAGELNQLRFQRS